MTFQKAVRTCFREKYLTIDGRAARSEYWYFWLFCLLANIALNIADTVFFPAAGLAPLTTLFNVAVCLPLITAGIRRLHDRDMSGWWLLLGLIPLVGSFVLLVLFVLPGTAGANRFGPDPLADDGPHDWPDDDANLSQSSIPRVSRE